MKRVLYNATATDGGGKRFSTSDPYQERRAFLVTTDKPVIDKEARTVELSFSSETPVERWFGSEILVHSADAIDLSRLNNGHPLLCNHDPEEQIGVVVRAWLDESTRKARAVVKFSRSADGEEVFQDVQDGIRGLVSVGYRVNSWLTEDTNGDGEPEVYRAVKWTPYEISIVSVPADPNVGVGRSAEQPKNSMNKNTLHDPGASGAGGGGAAAPVIDLVAERNKIRTEEAQRTAEIHAIQSQFERFGVTRDDANSFIRDGKPVDEFRKLAMDKIGAKPVETINPNIGMSEKEKRQFSVANAILQIATTGKLDGIEREASEAHCKRNGITLGDRRSFIIPHDVNTFQKRALSVGTYASGGALVGVEYDPTIIELLRNMPVLAQCGARQMVLPKVGNVLISKQTGGGTAYWLAENASVTESSMTVGQLLLTPKRLATYTLVSTSLLNQGSPDVEGLIRTDLATVLSLAKDKAGLHGLGAAGEPLGLLNTTGLGSASVSGSSISWANILAIEAALASANAEMGSIKWLTTPAARAVLKAEEKASSTAQFVCSENNMVNGYPLLVTNQLTSDKLIYGNWADMIMADYAGVEITVDQVTGLATDQVKVFAKLYCDIGIRHIESFVATSSTVS